jgi:hypothetical protein
VCLASDGGYLEIGRSPTDIKYDLIVEYDGKSGYYSVAGITAIKYGRASLFNAEAYRRRGFVLDTGSTLSMFPNAEYQRLLT